jgi:hypothetical protein
MTLGLWPAKTNADISANCAKSFSGGIWMSENKDLVVGPVASGFPRL